jgi:hypothetical protein
VTGFYPARAAVRFRVLAPRIAPTVTYQVVYALPFRWIYVTMKKKQPPGMAGPKPKSSRLRVLQVVVQEALKRTQQFHTRLGARKPLALVR